MRKSSTGTLPPSQSLNFKRSILMIGASLALSAVSATTALAEEPKPAGGDKPNILVIFGDDIGQTNISAYRLRRGRLQDAQHRPYRQRRHDVHRLLCRE